MRKHFVSLSAGLLLFSQLALAQDGEYAESGSLFYGAKLGGSLNQFSQPGTTFGGNAGGFVRYHIIDLLAVQGEVLYDLQGGGRHDYAPSFGDLDGSTAVFINRRLWMHTVSVPISAKIIPFAQESTSPYVIVGGNFQYIFSAIENRDVLFRPDVRANGDLIVTGQDANITDDIEDIQYGFHVGIGLDFYQSTGRVIGVELRYQQSLVNVNAGAEDLASPLRADLAGLYASSISVNFYASINSIF
ncbi:MAG: outer membrane beta-barrel protein [Bacteroidota bacterium]